MTRKQFISIAEQAGFEAGKIKAKKDGTFELRHSYFYTHGYTAEKWGEKVISALPEGEFELVRTSNKWAAWPHDSYFSAFVRPLAPGI